MKAIVFIVLILGGIQAKAGSLITICSEEASTEYLAKQDLRSQVADANEDGFIPFSKEEIHYLGSGKVQACQEVKAL